MALERLTNSNRSLFQECPRKFFYKVESGYLPVTESSALAFGTAFHKVLEIYFSTGDAEKASSIINTLELGIYEIVKIKELFDGYCKMWKPMKTVATEKEFSIPLLNPMTVGVSRTFEIAGKIDAIVETEDGSHAVVEHKTSGDNIGDPGCDYWLKLAIDPQISGYFVGAEKIGFKPTKTIYDVIGKPKLKPAKATPKEELKYKKDGGLYATCRLTDETPEEFAIRLREHIAEDPSRYFQRRDVARLDSDLIEYMTDMWSISKLIIESRAEGYWPKRTSQCFNYSRCPYYPVCAKIASLDDTSMFTKSETKNPELTTKYEGAF